MITNPAEISNTEEAILYWSDYILLELLKYRDSNKHLTFWLRSRESTRTDKKRLDKGYWFHGSDYISVGLTNVTNPNRRLQSISFVVELDNYQSPNCYLRFISVPGDEKLKEFNEQVHNFFQSEKGKFRLVSHNPGYFDKIYDRNVIEALPILINDFNLIYRLAVDSALVERLLIPLDDFNRKLDKILSIRKKRKIDNTKSKHNREIAGGEFISFFQSEYQNYWWLQANPKTWRVEDFEVGSYQEYSTHGINGNRRRVFEFFFEAKKDELIIIYESSPSRCIKALGRITKEASNQTSDTLGFEIIYYFENQTTWSTLLELASFRKTSLAQNNQGSLFKLNKVTFFDVLATTELNQKFGEDTYLDKYFTSVDSDSAYPVKDLLSFKNDIEAFANILALKDLNPPLAIALFGNWGSGKSFFMNSLELNIKKLCSGQTGEPTDFKYASEIAHIKFNAWSYLDANLWAGLMASIFEKLDEHINEQDSDKGDDEVKALRAQIGNQLELVKKQHQASIERQGKIQEEINKLEASLKTEEANLRKNLAEASIDNWSNMITKAWDGIELKQDLRKALKENGYEDEDIKKLSATSIKTEMSSLSQVLKAMVKNPIKFIGISLVVLAMASAIYLLKLDENLKVFLSVLIPSLPLITSFAKAFLKNGKIISELIKVEDQHNAAIRKLEEKYKADMVAFRLQRGEKETELTKISQKIKDLEIEKVQLGNELNQSLTKKALYSFIAKRSGSSDYEKHLGIISTIRRDLETLSSLFIKQKIDKSLPTREKQKLLKQEEELEKIRSKFDHPLERIILYIDDLDRCSDDKVLEVLQAVHLLMAFPLFVVVVGVDKRCVNNALRYRNLLQYNQYAPNNDISKLSVLDIDVIEPNEYLEKIFQIPFHLPSADTSDVKNMIGHFMNATEPVKSTEETFDSTREEVGLELDPIEQTEEDSSNEMENAFVETEHSVSREMLELDIEEQRIMQAFADIIGNNPRAIKRLINIYRIVRVHDELENQRFTGRDDYLIVIFLLVLPIGRFKDLNDDFKLKCKTMIFESLDDYLQTTEYEDRKVFDRRKELHKAISENDEILDVLYISLNDFYERNKFIERFTFSELV